MKRGIPRRFAFAQNIWTLLNNATQAGAFRNESALLAEQEDAKECAH